MLDMWSASLIEMLLFLKDVMYLWFVASLQCDAYRTATFVMFMIEYMTQSVLNVVKYAANFALYFHFQNGTCAQC